MELEIKSELQSKLIDYMTSLENGVNDIVDFGSEQAPILVQEILTFSLIERGVFVGVDILVVCLCLFGIKKLWPYLVGSVDDGNPLPVIGIILCTIGGLALAASAIKSILICVQIHFAPRLFMLEYVKNLIG